jgi:peptide/nickel transport system substrate-binding protein
MFNQRKIKCLALLLGAVLLLGASEGAGEGYKDSLLIAVTAQPPTLDGALTASTLSIGIGGNIFEQLYTMNADYVPTPELAESYTVSDNGLVYTFTLRKNVKFHNGKDMTAEDVVASMNRWLEVSARGKTLLGGSVFEKVDDHTVTLTVPTVTSDVLMIVSTRTFFPVIMPSEVVAGAAAGGVREYIGTGPYKLKEWKQDQYIHLEKYENYTIIDTPSSAYSGRKEAATPNLYYYFVTDHATRINGIKTGEYDVCESIPLENYDELKNLKNVILYSRTSGSLNVFFNTRAGILAEPKYRQAVMACMNMEEIMLASYADPAHFTLDPGYMNIRQPQWAVKNGQELYDQRNPGKTRELLDKLGYKGETITLLTTPDYQEMYAATMVLQEQLRQAGFTAEVAAFDFPTFMETKGNYGKWDIFITSNSYNIIPPMILAVNSSWAGFDAPEVAEGLKKIRGASGDAEARQAWAELQQFMYEYGSSTALGHYNSLMATTDKVSDFVFFDQPIYWNAKVAK